MTVVCESFLEHLRVQSQVLVSALELTWPPAGWALCRLSRPPPQPTLPYFATRRWTESSMWTGQQGNLLLARDPSFLPVSALYNLPLAISTSRVSCQLQMSVQCPPPLLAK